jgi:hypothetical protein
MVLIIIGRNKKKLHHLLSKQTNDKDIVDHQHSIYGTDVDMACSEVNFY